MFTVAFPQGRLIIFLLHICIYCYTRQECIKSLLSRLKHGQQTADRDMPSSLRPGKHHRVWRAFENKILIIKNKVKYKFYVRISLVIKMCIRDRLYTMENTRVRHSGPCVRSHMQITVKMFSLI